MNGLLHMHGPAVKKLLGWKIGEDEEKWCEKAVEALVKKLKKNNGGCGSLEDLESVLANPNSNSRCVTIPKSLDGRLQVSHKKGLPHVIYCRVWRWPDLSSHQELRSIETCMFPYENSSRNQQICINPYHYQRIVRSTPSSFNSQCSISSPQSIPSSPNGMWPSSSSTTSCASSPSPSIFSEDGDGLTVLPPRTPIKPSRSWATITYFELNTKVGEGFKLINEFITIDGYTDPSNSDTRICLGQLSNVNRNATVEKTRKHIGRGIALEHRENMQVSLINRSEMPVFVQSKNTNILMNQTPSKVCRIPPGMNIVVFDYALFFQMLERSRIDTLSELSKHCFMRISFVKGWGDDYPRQDVTSTPCWFELRISAPLKYIDQKMKQTPRIQLVEPNSQT